MVGDKEKNTIISRHFTQGKTNGGLSRQPIKIQEPFKHQVTNDINNQVPNGNLNEEVVCKHSGRLINHLTNSQNSNDENIKSSNKVRDSLRLSLKNVSFTCIRQKSYLI